MTPCACGRAANSTYGGKKWCCIQCFRFRGLQHTVFCDKRKEASANA